MPFKSLIFGLIMLTTVPKAFAERGNPNVQFEGVTIDAMIADFMEEHAIPGMTLAIVQAPYIPRVVGYGRSNSEQGLLASTKTLWNIGQITCAYTAVAIMQLVEEGKLGLEDTLGKYLTDEPKAWQGITFRQLLGHISGLPDYTKQPAFDFSKEYQPSQLLALVKDQPLQFQPGTQVAQSATNFLLLGLAIERISGMSYEAFVKKNQIERIGLKNTFFSSDFKQIKQETLNQSSPRHKEFLLESAYINPSETAVGYAEIDGKNTLVPRNNASGLNAYASLWASAEDISLWDIALAGSILVKKKENRDLIYHAVSLNDGTKIQANAGWRFYGHPGLMSIRGNVPGFSCYLSRFTDPNELVCVTLCANKEQVDLTELARRIAGAFSAKLGPPVGSNELVCFESCYDVATTMDRLEAFLKMKGVQIMARVDHTQGAAKVNLTLRPTQTLIFGNPALGTHLMLSNQSIAAALPLRVAVWQDEAGSVWLGHDEIKALAEAYDIENIDTIIHQMTKGLSAAVQHAIAPY